MSEQPVRFTGAIRFTPRRRFSVQAAKWNDRTLEELLLSLLYGSDRSFADRPQTLDVISRRIPWSDDRVPTVSAAISSLNDELQAEFDRFIDAPAS